MLSNHGVHEVFFYDLKISEREKGDILLRTPFRAQEM